MTSIFGFGQQMSQIDGLNANIKIDIQIVHNVNFAVDEHKSQLFPHILSHTHTHTHI